METTLPISGVIIVALGSLGIGVSIITSLTLILKKKTDNISNTILVVFLMLLGFTLTNEALTTSGITNRFKNLYFIPIYFSLSIGPFFYIFIKTRINHRFLKLDVLHLVLPLIQFLIYLAIGFRSIEYKSELWRNSIFRSYSSLESILFPVSLIFYGCLALSLLRQSNENSYFWQNDLKTWLNSMAQIFFIIAILETILFASELFFIEERFGIQIYILRILFFVILILWISYHTIMILNPINIYKTNPKVKDSILSLEEISHLKRRLSHLFEMDKIYLNSDLNLNILAKYLETTPKKCSYLLRAEFEQNFNQFVNLYRVKEFKKMVKTNKLKSETLLSLAFASGFPSKSTFNRTFKSIQGQTPSEYINSNKLEEK